MKYELKCPICWDGNLALCQDAIVPHDILKNKDGSFGFVPVSKDINYLDNTWLECAACGSTSKDEKALEKIYDRITG